uniref:Uncharacterized protein n=1 Tax=Chromera velia CCMP2878 TaxID=1169474 RepID=A0A0G4I1W6_9ALVE|eukprot:Cvel_10240.t1-p1 / transcript=Cvel_10240.t1 / gene=Cvel_10240 / organism=Chromera_velia_CCMP2878 / gene_product=hypothetical protein / transcript_product=hypothetical protein / location=Cvel_scaffold613:49962-51880(+) / protein_length=519 / sequence_SO=supercontig / SO=protein_coding / is_pseudo=false
MKEESERALNLQPFSDPDLTGISLLQGRQSQKAFSDRNAFMENQVRGRAVSIEEFPSSWKERDDPHRSSSGAEQTSHLRTQTDRLHPLGKNRPAQSFCLTGETRVGKVSSVSPEVPLRGPKLAESPAAFFIPEKSFAAPSLRFEKKVEDKISGQKRGNNDFPPVKMKDSREDRFQPKNSLHFGKDKKRLGSLLLNEDLESEASSLFGSECGGARPAKRLRFAPEANQSAPSNWCPKRDSPVVATTAGRQCPKKSCPAPPLHRSELQRPHCAVHAAESAFTRKPMPSFLPAWQADFDQIKKRPWIPDSPETVLSDKPAKGRFFESGARDMALHAFRKEIRSSTKPERPGGDPLQFDAKPPSSPSDAFRLEVKGSTKPKPPGRSPLQFDAKPPSSPSDAFRLEVKGSTKPNPPGGGPLQFDAKPPSSSLEAFRIEIQNSAKAEKQSGSNLQFDAKPPSSSLEAFRLEVIGSIPNLGQPPVHSSLNPRSLKSPYQQSVKLLSKALFRRELRRRMVRRIRRRD